MGDALINNESPAETALRYAVIAAVTGAGLGAAAAKLKSAKSDNTMLKSIKEKLNNGQKERGNPPQTDRRTGAEDERIRYIRRLYTADNGNIRPYTRRSNGSSSSRLVVHEPVSILKNEYSKYGWRTDVYYELNNDDQCVDTFINSFKQSNEFQGKWAAQVHEYTAEEYKRMRLFVSENGTSGFAIKNDGDIVSVFSSAKGSSKAMLELAVQNGGRKLDCFDTYLPQIYRQHGFKEVHREKWNEQYKPENWDKDFYSKYNNGEPDVVYMELEM